MPRLIKENGVKKPTGAFEAFVDERDFSFRELSRKSGVSEITLRRIKNGQSVKRGTVRKLHKFFRVDKQTILDLFRLDGVTVVK